jgi:hypothetical protein
MDVKIPIVVMSLCMYGTTHREAINLPNRESTVARVVYYGTPSSSSYSRARDTTPKKGKNINNATRRSLYNKLLSIALQAPNKAKRPRVVVVVVVVVVHIVHK